MHRNRKERDEKDEILLEVERLARYLGKNGVMKTKEKYGNGFHTPNKLYLRSLSFLFTVEYFGQYIHQSLYG